MIIHSLPILSGTPAFLLSLAQSQALCCPLGRSMQSIVYLTVQSLSPPSPLLSKAEGLELTWSWSSLTVDNSHASGYL